MTSASDCREGEVEGRHQGEDGLNHPETPMGVETRNPTLSPLNLASPSHCPEKINYFLCNQLRNKSVRSCDTC